MGKGNFIGIVNNPSNTSVTGVWNLFEHRNAVSSNTWLYVPSIVSSGLVLYLDAGNPASYPGSGSTWFDLSGNANHTTLFNSPTWSSANGGTFTFNGSNQYAQAPTAAGSANFTTGMTIFCFFNMGSASFWERIIDFGVGQANDNIYFARRDTTNILRLGILNPSTDNGIEISDGIVNNTIASYAVTINGTTGVLYRNATSLLSQSYTTLPRNVTRASNYIGRSNWPDAYFETTMHVLMIYNRALSQAEITQNFNAFRGRYGL